MTAGENLTDAPAAAAAHADEGMMVAAAAVATAAAAQPDGGGEDDSDDAGITDAARAQKRKERLEQNRISARESRKRKKTMIEELQRTVITLSKENKDLNDRNEQLRSQLMEVGRKYPSVVSIQAIMNGAPPPAPQQAQVNAAVAAANAATETAAQAPAP